MRYRSPTPTTPETATLDAARASALVSDDRAGATARAVAAASRRDPRIRVAHALRALAAARARAVGAQKS